jgi:acyl-CoA dehydrogenase
MPFARWVMESFHMGLADGATEIHKTNLARQLLRDHNPAPGLFPTGHLPTLRAEAMVRYGDDLL